MTHGSIRRAGRGRWTSPIPALALVLAGLMAFFGPQPGALAQPCEPQWAEGLFGVSGVNGYVHAMLVFDDGTGEALYAGGNFTTAGGVAANRIARWDGSAWSPLGLGTNGRIHALAAFDDGSGPGLYMGGTFTTAGGVALGRMARWGCIAEPCRADLDGDGVLTLLDFLRFQNLFAAGDPAADFDGDGQLTLFDFLEFQNAFVDGCA